jgi:hypothetical protein
MQIAFRMVLFALGAVFAGLSAFGSWRFSEHPWTLVGLILLAALFLSVAIFWRAFLAIVLRQIGPDKVFNGPPEG